MSDFDAANVVTAKDARDAAERALAGNRQKAFDGLNDKERKGLDIVMHTVQEAMKKSEFRTMVTMDYAEIMFSENLMTYLRLLGYEMKTSATMRAKELFIFW